MAQNEFNSNLDARRVDELDLHFMNDTRLWFRANSMSWDYITDWYITLVNSGLEPGPPDPKSGFDHHGRRLRRLGTDPRRTALQAFSSL